MAAALLSSAASLARALKQTQFDDGLKHFCKRAAGHQHKLYETHNLDTIMFIVGKCGPGSSETFVLSIATPRVSRFPQATDAEETIVSVQQIAQAGQKQAPEAGASAAAAFPQQLSRLKPPLKLAIAQQMQQTLMPGLRWLRSRAPDGDMAAAAADDSTPVSAAAPENADPATAADADGFQGFASIDEVRTSHSWLPECFEVWEAASLWSDAQRDEFIAAGLREIGNDDVASILHALTWKINDLAKHAKVEAAVTSFRKRVAAARLLQQDPVAAMAETAHPLDSTEPLFEKDGKFYVGKRLNVDECDLLFSGLVKLRKNTKLQKDGLMKFAGEPIYAHHLYNAVQIAGGIRKVKVPGRKNEAMNAVGQLLGINTAPEWRQWVRKQYLKLFKGRHWYPEDEYEEDVDEEDVDAEDVDAEDVDEEDVDAEDVHDVEDFEAEADPGSNSAPIPLVQPADDEPATPAGDADRQAPVVQPPDIVTGEDAAGTSSRASTQAAVIEPPNIVAGDEAAGAPEGEGSQTAPAEPSAAAGVQDSAGGPAQPRSIVNLPAAAGATLRGLMQSTSPEPALLSSAGGPAFADTATAAAIPARNNRHPNVTFASPSSLEQVFVLPTSPSSAAAQTSHRAAAAGRASAADSGLAAATPAVLPRHSARHSAPALAPESDDTSARQRGPQPHAALPLLDQDAAGPVNIGPETTLKRKRPQRLPGRSEAAKEKCLFEMVRESVWDSLVSWAV